MTMNTGSTASMHLAKAWLAECMVTHENCPKAVAPPWQPKGFWRHLHRLSRSYSHRSTLAQWPFATLSSHHCY